MANNLTNRRLASDRVPSVWHLRHRRISAITWQRRVSAIMPAASITSHRRPGGAEEIMSDHQRLFHHTSASPVVQCSWRRGLSGGRMSASGLSRATPAAPRRRRALTLMKAARHERQHLRAIVPAAAAHAIAGGMIGADAPLASSARVRRQSHRRGDDRCASLVATTLARTAASVPRKIRNGPRCFRRRRAALTPAASGEPGRSWQAVDRRKHGTRDRRRKKARFLDPPMRRGEIAGVTTGG